MHGELGNQLGHMLRREELAARFAGIGGVVGDEEFVGIAEEVDVAAFKIGKVQLGHALEHGCQTEIFVLHRVAKAVAGGVEISKQAADVALRRVAQGGTFNGGEDGGQIGVQALIGVGLGHHVGKQLAGVDEIALGFDRVVLEFRRDDLVG